MSRRLLALLSLSLLAACSAFRTTPQDAAEPSALVARAQSLADQGSFAQARQTYLEVLRDHPNDAAAFDARYGMAQIRLDTRSPLRDYRLALVNLDRLVEQYGRDGGLWLQQVENWRAVLKKLQTCEAKSQKLARDADRVRELESDMDRLRELDLELEIGR